MDCQALQGTAAAAAYIEAHLGETLDLGRVAEAVCYSKYHLHRMFTDTAGLTPRAYIQRRRLTEAARALAGSQRPLAEIALAAGYGSQQAFSAVFKAMYKQTPRAYRQGGTFYPLQLPLALNPSPAGAGTAALAGPADLPGWMALLSQVVDGFPHLEPSAHRRQIEGQIARRQALVLRDGPTIAAAAAFSYRTGEIGFLAVHPQYRRRGAEEALLAVLTEELLPGRPIAITTFRAGDRADTGQRAAYRRLGFREAELLTEFGYPTQRLVLGPGERRL